MSASALVREDTGGRAASATPSSSLRHMSDLRPVWHLQYRQARGDHVAPRCRSRGQTCPAGEGRPRGDARSAGHRRACRLHRQGHATDRSGAGPAQVVSRDVLLGRQSDTDDVTGAVTEVVVAREVSATEIERAFAGVRRPYRAGAADFFRRACRTAAGPTSGLGPGRRSADAATVEVFRLEITRFAYPELELDIDCGSGTYVRSIGRDLGQVLGCGAVMSALVRTRVGPYRHRKRDRTRRSSLADTSTHLYSTPRRPLPVCRKRVANDEEIALLRAGRAIPIGDVSEVRTEIPSSIVDGSRGLLALATARRGQPTSLRPYRVFID